MKQRTTYTVLGTLLPLLMACGGGDGYTVITTKTPLSTTLARNPSQTYTTLANTADTRSSLVTDQISTNGTSGEQTVISTSGLLDNKNKAFIMLSEGGYSFSSTGAGLSTTGASSGANNGSIIANTDLSSGYQYLMVYQSTTFNDGTPFNAQGILGVATGANDIPDQGVAQYAGGAELLVVTENGGSTVLENGSSVMAADFGSMTAELRLDDFTAQDGSGNAVSNAPMTAMEVTGISISGNSFSGGTITTYSGNTPVDVTGSNTTEVLEGHFYGFNSSTGAPDEVGGVILMEGDRGKIQGIFVAD